MPETDQDTTAKIEQRRNQLKAIKDKIRVSKVVYTRSIKGRNGDSFAGFSAGWDTHQDDVGGPGADLDVSPQEGPGTTMSLSEAEVAYYMIALKTELCALRSARANGAISDEYFRDSESAIRKNYVNLINGALE